MQNAKCKMQIGAKRKSRSAGMQIRAISFNRNWR
jgi:hypothetical protein